MAGLRIVLVLGVLGAACGGRVGDSASGNSSTIGPDDRPADDAITPPPVVGTTTSPPPLLDASAPDTAVFTLFGGSNGWGHYLDDTWEWREDSGWTQKAGAGSAPGPDARSGAMMASLAGRTFLFGGIATGSADIAGRGDTWEWDGTTWTKRDVAGPSPRWNSKAAVLSDKVVLFGGYGPGPNGKTTYLGDTWEWDGATWTERKVAGPLPRTVHAMTTFAGKILLYGGQGEGGLLNDTWEWDGTTWTKRDVAATPEARSAPALATLAGTPVLFGGGLSGQLFDRTWQWDGGWTERDVTGPTSRASAAMAAAASTLVLFGGNTVEGSTYVYFADTWSWDGTRWNQRGDAGGTSPVGRTGAAMSARVSTK